METAKSRHMREKDSPTSGVKLVEHLDLSTFKMSPCTLGPNHNHKQCLYYHSSKDMRRGVVEVGYEAELCFQMNHYGRCPMGDQCKYAHNKVEQAYHPSKYRFKFCSNFPGTISGCPYGKFCSYAHSEQEIKGELIHNYTFDVDFFLYLYKTKFCPFTKPHERSLCVYAHNWQDFRRDPSCSSYSPVECRHWRSGLKVAEYEAQCPNGMECGSCHGNFGLSGLKELHFHPENYKKEPCNSRNCISKDLSCPFYHTTEDTM